MTNINIVLCGENHFNAKIVPFILKQLDKLFLDKKRIIFGIEQPDEFEIEDQKQALKSQLDTFEDNIKIYAIYSKNGDSYQIQPNVKSDFLKNSKVIKDEKIFDKMIENLRDNEFRRNFLQEEIPAIVTVYAADNKTLSLFDYLHEKNIICFPIDLPQAELYELTNGSYETQAEFDDYRDQLEPRRIDKMTQSIIAAIHANTGTEQTDLFVFVLTGMEHTQRLKNKLKTELAKSHNQSMNARVTALRFFSNTFDIEKDFRNFLMSIVPDFQSSHYLKSLIEVQAREAEKVHVSNQATAKLQEDSEIFDLSPDDSGQQKFDEIVVQTNVHKKHSSK